MEAKTNAFKEWYYNRGGKELIASRPRKHKEHEPIVERGYCVVYDPSEFPLSTGKLLDRYEMYWGLELGSLKGVIVRKGTAYFKVVGGALKQIDASEIPGYCETRMPDTVKPKIIPIVRFVTIDEREVADLLIE